MALENIVTFFGLHSLKKGAFCYDFEVQVANFESNFLSFIWSKWDKLSAYQTENFLNFSKHT